MFDFLKEKKEGQPLDVKTTRNKILIFIKEQLQKWEGGEGANIKGIQFFLAPAAEEKQLFETAVYYNDEDRFKNEEVQKIADDYAIELPVSWNFEIFFGELLPDEAFKAKDLPVGLYITSNKKPAINKNTVAYLKVLSGEAENKRYVVTSGIKKICIGRDRETQTAEGFHRVNDIAFPAGSSNEGNKYISRQHAHIEWDNESGSFFLFADEGGIPPRNKVKVQTTSGSQIKLQTTEVGHLLQEGDQIILGASALLQFSYIE